MAYQMGRVLMTLSELEGFFCCLLETVLIPTTEEIQHV